MNDSLKKHLLGSTMVASLIVAGYSAPAYAQATSPSEAEVVDDVDELDLSGFEDDDDMDEVVATGSRIRRDSFSSISPLQVITADTVIDAGLTNTADIVKSQTVISGVQLDTNINSAFVTNGGPGASNVSLRGLGEDRTLVLVNGRRLAPAGVEGAPSLPDLNLIPSSLVQRVETLLDGASSVYGSDAVAGVVNVILRDEFDGFRVDGSVTHPFESGGGTRRISAIMGDTGSRGNYVAGVEYRIQDELNLRDRSWQQDDEGQYCSLDVEVDSTTGELFKNCGGAIGSAEFGGFVSPLGDGAEVGNTGFFGISNSRAPNFRSNSLEALDNLLNEQEALTAYISANRQINPLGLDDTNFFFEAQVANVQTRVRSGFHGQIFPTVAADNAFNPFGRSAVPVIFSPIRRSDIDVDVLQYRLVGGIEGDVTGLEGWSYEANASYSRSIGDSVRPVVLEDRLALTLRTTEVQPDGTITCGNDGPDNFGFFTLAPCVPVNFFAPSLYNGLNPQFATQAEFDYLRGERSVTTKVDQLNLSGFFTGPIFELPAGEVQVVLGGEYRVDGLNSGVDTIASEGGAAGFFADANSVGQVSQVEGFAEIDIPLLSDMTLAEDLTINLSGRIVDNEFYSTETVYAIKGSYTPVDWLTLRSTFGTSYRSPGARELFLGGQTSFASGNFDPCVVPVLARAGGVYDPSEDNRLERVLENCRLDGVDPLALGLDGVPSVTSIRRGNITLDPETSESFTAGFTFEQPFTDAFDFLFSMTYFDITVDDAPQTPGASVILSNCYNSASFATDPFCALVRRDGNTGFVLEVDNTPFNLATFGAEGFDYNLRGVFDFSLGERDFTFVNDTVVTNQTGRNSQLLPTSPVGDSAGDIGFPEWRGTSNFRLATGDLSMFWGVRYIGEQEDINSQTGLINVRGVDGRLTTGARTSSDTIVQNIDDYWRHDVSVRYQGGDDWGIVVGINNLFDEEPPLIDQDVSGESLIGNVPGGIGYDLRGRSMFVTLNKTF
ncbi:MAG: TonB-dependent receptor [Litorimonas sp.]